MPPRRASSQDREPLRQRKACQSDGHTQDVVNPRTQEKPSSPLPLRRLSDTPQYLHTRYVLSGYRVDYSAWECIRSTWHLTNETFNIWSHFLWTIFLLYRWYTIPDSAPSLSGAFLLCSATTVLCSSLFHTFNSMSPLHYLIFARIDFVGIMTSIVISNLLYVAYGFHHFPAQRALHEFVIFFLAVAAISILLFPCFHRPEYRWCRVFIFIATATYCLVFWPHMMFVMHPNTERAWRMLPSLAGVLSFYTFGVVLAMWRLPERFSPGSFDIFGQSHHWWHIVVCVAELLLYNSYLGLHAMGSN